MFSNIHATVVLWIIASWLIITASAACYYPDGTLARNDKPCGDDTVESACCAQGYACMSNGICQTTGLEIKYAGAAKYARGSCTDKTWRSSSCPTFCNNPDVDNMSGGSGLEKCEDTDEDLYWCINKVKDRVDCKNKKGVQFFAGTPSAITTIGVAPIATTTSASISTSPSSTTSSATTAPVSQSEAPPAPSTSGASETNETQSDDSTKNNSSGVIAGAIAGSAAVIIIGGLIFWFVRRRRNKRLEASTGDAEPANYYHHFRKQDGFVAANPSGVFEATGSTNWENKSLYTEPSELPGAVPIHDPQEMPTRSHERG